MTNNITESYKVYKIADILFALDDKSCKIPKSGSDFICDTNEYDYYISNSQDDLDQEKNYFVAKNENMYKIPATTRKIIGILSNHNAMLFHCASFEVDGQGVAFAARSGTGKTTQFCLWQQLLGERMKVINGDKPIVRFFDDNDQAPDDTITSVPYIYGSPWKGKEGIGDDTRAILKHICFIERSENNYVEKISKADAVNRVFNQVYIPRNPLGVNTTMQLIDKMLSYCELWIIHCNMDIEAADIAYKSIFEK